MQHSTKGAYLPLSCYPMLQHRHGCPQIMEHNQLIMGYGHNPCIHPSEVNYHSLHVCEVADSVFRNPQPNNSEYLVTRECWSHNIIGCKFGQQLCFKWPGTVLSGNLDMFSSTFLLLSTYIYIYHRCRKHDVIQDGGRLVSRDIFKHPKGKLL